MLLWKNTAEQIRLQEVLEIGRVPAWSPIEEG